ncbi:chaperonin CPN60-like 2, mitochondrial [Musa acuminata AAA Group]|uniref:chaperonin CPN60-like 2, mitochondrial n=1 Tax=Musa acuminata AAA Group TaxID=214697 RepID=UPI0031DFFC21
MTMPEFSQWPGYSDPTFIMLDIREYCKSFSTLKVMGCYTEHFAATALLVFRGLKVLSLRCCKTTFQAILSIVGMRHLEELESPIHDKKISDMNSLVQILELPLKNHRALLIVADDLESDALAMLLLNKHCAGIKVHSALVFGENRRANLEDLAILTGGEDITEDGDMNLETVKVEMLSTVKKVTVSLDDAIILHGGADKKLLEERFEHLTSTMEKSTTMFDKEKAQEWLSKLSGGVAVLGIGGASEAEVSEKKDRVTDALNAARAAVEEGILPGGGVSLLYATKELDKIQTSNSDENIGVQIIKNALKAPTLTIAGNAGVDGAVVVGKLLEQENLNLGYDAAKGEYVDMVEAGIIDPLKVVRTALVDAASVSVLLTTTEAAVSFVSVVFGPSICRYQLTAVASSVKKPRVSVAL